MPLNSSFLIYVLYSHQELVLVLLLVLLIFIIRSLIYWPSYSPPCEIYFTAPRGFVICKPHVTVRAAWPNLVNVLLSVSFMNEMCINLSIITKNYRWLILLNAHDVGGEKNINVQFFYFTTNGGGGLKSSFSRSIRQYHLKTKNLATKKYIMFRMHATSYSQNVDEPTYYEYDIASSKTLYNKDSLTLGSKISENLNP